MSSACLHSVKPEFSFQTVLCKVEAQHFLPFPPLPSHCLQMGMTKTTCPQELLGEFVLITKHFAKCKILAKW